MGELVANLLQFSRRGRGEISTVDVFEELTKAVELIHHHLRKRLVTVVKEFTPDTPTIYADRQKLRQVFLNLLSNASDAMPQGGRLTLRTAPVMLYNGRAGVKRSKFKKECLGLRKGAGYLDRCAREQGISTGGF